MKVVHWTAHNKSGMNRVAETMQKFERAAGNESYIANSFEVTKAEMEPYLDADIHVSHTYLPEWFKKRITNKNYKLVWVGHGTPEHVFQTSVIDGAEGNYGHNDGLMLQQYYMQNADAIITHWPRHAAIYRCLCDKKTPIHVIPLGVDKSFWKKQPSRGKWSGEPSLFSSENCHYIKWPYELLTIWPLVYPRLKTEGCLHVSYLPMDMHRWFFPLVNRNGASYACHISGKAWPHEHLVNILNSVDYYIGLVQKGDFNRMSHEANACGCKTISFAGNPYSDFWLPEGDQRVSADILVNILNGNIEPRKKDVVPSAEEMTKAMLDIYANC